jgi:hypothetical protein
LIPHSVLDVFKLLAVKVKIVANCLIQNPGSVAIERFGNSVYLIPLAFLSAKV